MKASWLVQSILLTSGIVGVTQGCADDSGTGAGGGDSWGCDFTEDTFEPMPGCIIQVAGEVDLQCETVPTVDGRCPSADEVWEFGVSASCGPKQEFAEPVGGGGAGGGGAPAGTGGAGGTGGVGSGGDAAGGGDALGGGTVGGGGGSAVGAGGAGGGPQELGSCCYYVANPYLCGRPLLVLDEVRQAARLSGNAPCATGVRGGDLSPELSRFVGQQWIDDAFMEHASVAAFARFALHLMALGAPSDLVEDTQRAMADELRHARLCFEIAARYGVSATPGALDFGQVDAAEPWTDILTTTIREGCVGETVAALIAGRAAAAAVDPQARALLQTIAEDEARHASLAWRFVAWAVKVHGEEARSILRLEIQRAASACLATEAPRSVRSITDMKVARDHGRLSDAARREIAKEAIFDVVRPCAQAIANAAANVA